ARRRDRSRSASRGSKPADAQAVGVGVLRSGTLGLIPAIPSAPYTLLHLQHGCRVSGSAKLLKTHGILRDFGRGTMLRHQLACSSNAANPGHSCSEIDYHVRNREPVSRTDSMIEPPEPATH